MKLADRLKKGAEALDQFAAKRVTNTMTPDDFDEEYLILVTELWALEEDVVRDPGALARHLVPVKRHRRVRPE